MDAVVDSIWDAVVIGAGPAGAIAARQLAQLGRKVLLVERQRFPRDKSVGGYLNGQAISALRSLGLHEVLAAAAPASLRHFVVQAGRRRADLELSAGAIVKRSVFDAALVRAARQAGADFLSETRATVAAMADVRTDSCTVHLHRHGTETHSIRARVVVAADGLGHPSLQNDPEFACHTAPCSRVGLGISLADNSPAYDSGTIYMAVAREGYVGLVRTAGGDLNLAGTLDMAAVKGGGGPAMAIRSVLQRAGMPPITALPSGGWRGTRPLTCSSARLASSRVFLVGDAAGYVEPFTGEGMAWAISSAASAVPYIMHSLDAWDERLARQWEVVQRRRMRQGQWACRVLAAALRKPRVVSTALTLLARHPALPFVRRISARSIELQASFP